jgi:hypothetical protein
MPHVAFEDLPDHGRLWVFAADRPLEPEETQALLVAVDGFLAGWAAHGVPLRCGREWLHDRFLLIGVDEDAEAPSGCSIDALVNRLGELGDAIGAILIDHSPVWYRADDGIRTVSRSDFRALAEGGEVTPGTLVFDTSLTRVGDLRGGALERPAAQSWHGRAFFRTPATS